MTVLDKEPCRVVRGANDFLIALVGHMVTSIVCKVLSLRYDVCLILVVVQFVKLSHYLCSVEIALLISSSTRSPLRSSPAPVVMTWSPGFNPLATTTRFPNVVPSSTSVRRATELPLFVAATKTA